MRVFTHFATKGQMFIRAGLYPTSQEIHIKQGAGTYLHITSFNGRVIHFLNPEIHHISNNRENLSPFWEILMKYRPFNCNIDHKFKNIDRLSKMVDYRPMVVNIDPVAALNSPKPHLETWSKTGHKVCEMWLSQGRPNSSIAVKEI